MICSKCIHSDGNSLELSHTSHDRLLTTLLVVGVITALAGVLVLLRAHHIIQYGWNVTTGLKEVGYSSLGLGLSLLLARALIQHHLRKQEFYKTVHSFLKQSHPTLSVEEVRRIIKLTPQSGQSEKEITDTLNKNVIYSGPGIYQKPEKEEAGGALFSNFLLARTDSLPCSFFTAHHLYSFLYRQDKNFLEEWFRHLQQALKESLNLPPKDKHLVIEPFVFNILALMAYTCLSKGMIIQIPVQQKDRWELVDYQVDKMFELSPSWFSAPLPAYGLVSKNNKNAPSIITCQGTTYPAGRGFIASLLSDYTPFFSVGHAASLYGQKSLQNWLDSKNNVHIVGISLGASISLFIPQIKPNAISKVYAFNPPGNYPWDRCKNSGDHIEYHIFSNENDLVSKLGYFPIGDHVHFYRVLSNKKENCFFSHNRMFCAGERVLIVKSLQAAEHQRIDRIAMTILHTLASSPLFLTTLSLYSVYRIIKLPYQIAAYALK